MPRLILQMSSPPGMTDAVVTSAPKRVSVSVMHVVSISSEPSAMGTSTRLDILKADVRKARLDEERKACDPDARNAAKTIRMATTMVWFGLNLFYVIEKILKTKWRRDAFIKEYERHVASETIAAERSC